MIQNRSAPAASRLVVAATAVLLVTGCSSAGTADPGTSIGETVSTPRGEVVGQRDGDVLRFRGIPFAEPPTGERRFAAPVPVAPWTQPLTATESGPVCPQLDGTGAVVGDEDCLHLDITVPALRSQALRPVMVWLHGGGFTEGSGSAYDPQRMAVAGDVVAVTVDYRLGALGNLAAPGLPDGGSFGVLDQQEALRFVQDVAGSFGGDPDQVTLFGESAGGTAVCQQLLAPGARGLFARAIVQSAIDCGAPTPPNAFSLPVDGADPPPGTDLASVEARGAQAAAELGCTTDLPTCLRAAPLAAVMALHTRFDRPATGTAQVPTPPWERLGDVDVPVLTGFTRDESRFYPVLAALLGAPFAEGTYAAAVGTSFPDRAADILQRYPPTDFPDDATAWSAVYTDATFACPALYAAEQMADSTDVATYTFQDRTAPPPLPLLPGAPDPGAAHSTELPYLFDVAGQPLDIEGNRIPLTLDQQSLTATMLGVWTSFAHGDQAAPRWDDDRTSLAFTGTGTTTTQAWGTHQCDLWNPSAPSS